MLAEERSLELLRASMAGVRVVSAQAGDAMFAAALTVVEAVVMLAVRQRWCVVYLEGIGRM